jgi:hypothetical protein
MNVIEKVNKKKDVRGWSTSIGVKIQIKSFAPHPEMKPTKKKKERKKNTFRKKRPSSGPIINTHIIPDKRTRRSFSSPRVSFCLKHTDTHRDIIRCASVERKSLLFLNKFKKVFLFLCN